MLYKKYPIIVSLIIKIGYPKRKGFTLLMPLSDHLGKKFPKMYYQVATGHTGLTLSLIHISEPTRLEC